MKSTTADFIAGSSETTPRPAGQKVGCLVLASDRISLLNTEPFISAVRLPTPGEL